MRGQDALARLVAHPEQDLGRRPDLRAPRERNDRLHVELELVLLERALEPLEPLDLAALAREHLVARGVDVDPAAALLLRDVARGVCGGQHAFGRAAVLAHFDEADADADVEHAVLPRKLVIGHGLTDVVGDLPRFVERTAREQHRELVAAYTRHGVRVAHLLLQERRDLAQRLSPAMWPELSFTSLNRSRSR
jgi:hypothetical protein